LRPSAYDLLGDSESFLEDLSDNDLATINGGGFWDRLLNAVVEAIIDFVVDELR
jgi:bacteriocin-like protein